MYSMFTWWTCRSSLVTLICWLSITIMILVTIWSFTHLWVTQLWIFNTGNSLPVPSRKLATVIKCSPFLSFLIVALWGIYRWLSFGSARWLIEILSAIGSFWGNDLYDALVYERKFKSEYLKRQIYEQSQVDLPSWSLSRIRATYQSYLHLVNLPS